MWITHFREASALLGELASVLVDTDAFTNFIRDQGREEGCGQNGLMEESMKQAERAGSSSDELGPRMDGCQTVIDCVCCWKSCVTETYLWGTLGSLRNGLLATPISSGTVACTTHGGIDIGDSTPEGSLQQSCHWALQVKVYKGDRGNYMSKGFGIWVLRSWHICEKTRPSIFWDRSKGSTSPRQAFWDEAWNANPTLEASYLKHFEFSALLRFPKKSHEIAFVQGPATLESTSTCRKKTAFAAFANVSL